MVRQKMEGSAQMDKKLEAAKEVWEGSFQEQIEKQAFNTAPVEALARTVSYHLRSRYRADQMKDLHFLEMGSGGGANLLWLAEKGIQVSGIDISATALELSRQRIKERGLWGQVRHLEEASVTDVPLPDGSVDGIIEACVFQHLDKDDRRRAFQEVRRLLKPGGVFVGYMLDQGHTIYQKKRDLEMPDDPGSLVLGEGGSNIYLSNIGLAHFYSREELLDLMQDFQEVDPCLTTYYLPRAEARKRGYDEYLQSMWTVYAVR